MKIDIESIAVRIAKDVFHKVICSEFGPRALQSEDELVNNTAEKVKAVLSDCKDCEDIYKVYPRAVLPCCGDIVYYNCNFVPKSDEESESDSENNSETEINNNLPPAWVEYEVLAVGSDKDYDEDYELILGRSETVGTNPSEEIDEVTVHLSDFGTAWVNNI